jgi:hypothetical protein
MKWLKVSAILTVIFVVGALIVPAGHAKQWDTVVVVTGLLYFGFLLIDALFGDDDDGNF